MNNNSSHITFDNLGDLLAHVKKDKMQGGSLSATANRYPIRFVLFDNFEDSFDFVDHMSNNGCKVESVEKWLDKDYDDIIISYSKLANMIKAFICEKSNNDYIIAPFSELARFYNNNSSIEFDSLISTIKSIETTKEGFVNKQRVYIPIVGLEGKMSRFYEDTQSYIWYLKSPEPHENYTLVLTDGDTFGVNRIEDSFSVVSNLKEWLNIWQQKDIKKNIISKSRSLFAFSEYAQPDNAFDFCVCNNVFDFLTKGLKLNFGAITYKHRDKDYWLRLAKEIDIKNFSFEKFFNKYFQIYNLSDYNVFLSTWFDCKDEFEKWLLTNYYYNKFCEKGYICKTIENTDGYTNNDFFSSSLLSIFDCDNMYELIEERNACLKVASEKGVNISQEVQDKLSQKLTQIAKTEGYGTALKYFSPLTDAEKVLAIEWLSQDLISKEDIKDFFPDLYHYLDNIVGTSASWVVDYINKYKKSKLRNEYIAEVETIINDKNRSDVSFSSWYNEFKTTKTILQTRTDIDVYYWIDGLGIEWIPYIKYLIEHYKNDEMYVNDIKIAQALYPTTTGNNKQALLDISNGKLEKIGNLDENAHKPGKKFPYYILEELDLVKEAIEEIIAKYNRKKIAIVSDHGLTALSQFCLSMNLAGADSDHHGRLCRKANPVSDKDYIICNDGKTLCALKHKSLCNKIPSGQIVHGGCTPEEILVPIIIISSQKEDIHFVAKLLSTELSSANSVVKYSIKGISSVVVPKIKYNGSFYDLNFKGNNIYESAPLSQNLDQNCTKIELIIGDKQQTDSISLNLGAEEEDLFDF